jgi:anti-sigma factor RsiW
MLALFWKRLTAPPPDTTPGQARLAGLLGLLLGGMTLLAAAVLYQLLVQVAGPAPGEVVTRHNRSTHFFALTAFPALALVATSGYRLVIGAPRKPPSSLVNVLTVLFILLASLVLFFVGSYALGPWVESLLSPESQESA